MAAHGGLGGMASQPPDPVQTRLETLLFEATNPSKQTNNINVIKQFCDTINMSPEGPILAARLLGHRVQSPQDQEALQALAVLEAAVKACGRAFHQEIAKFKFLNELIKLVSPKYLGSQRPQHVKQRVIELLFCWTREIPEEKKIQEAYAMLKAQGVITEDPEYVATAVFAPSLPPRQPELDEEQQQKLRKLLQSKNPEDLQTANLIIKSMVSKDEERMERLSKRLQQLQSVTSNVKLLDDMIASHRRTGSSSEEQELMAELSSSCEKLRPGLYRLASELAEDDSSIGEVLAASDELTRVIDTYKALVAGGDRTGSADNMMVASNSALLAARLEPSTSAVTNLLDLDPLASPTAAPVQADIPKETNLLSSENVPVAENLSSPSFSLSTPGIPAKPFTAAQLSTGTSDASPVNLAPINPSSAGLMSPTIGKWSIDHTDEVKEKTKSKRGMQDLDLLGETLIRENLTGQNLTNFETRKSEKLPLNSMKREAEPETSKKPEARDLTQELCESINTSCNVITNASDENMPKPSQVETKCDDTPKKVEDEVEEAVKWNDIQIAMSKIQPNKAISPIQLQGGDPGESDCLNVALHFASNKISGWPGVAVTVLTFSSTLPSEVSDLKFTPVMPRGCKARLLSPSSGCLPPFSPFAPPPAATQVMIVSGSSEEKSALPASIGFVLNYTLDGETVTDIGKDIKLPADIWTE